MCKPTRRKHLNPFAKGVAKNALGDCSKTRIVKYLRNLLKLRLENLIPQIISAILIIHAYILLIDKSY
jgi:hypothetical protein